LPSPPRTSTHFLKALAAAAVAVPGNQPALGAVAYVMRRRLLEADYTRVRFTRLPLVEAFQTSWRDIVRGFVIVVAFGVAFYLIFVYLATYFQQVDKMSATRALTINSISMLFLLTITPQLLANLPTASGEEQSWRLVLLGSSCCPGRCSCC
jgi:membrane protease YdiL (CAAX protease family)